METFDKFVFICVRKPSLATLVLHVQKKNIWDISITDYRHNLKFMMWSPLKVKIEP